MADYAAELLNPSPTRKAAQRDYATELFGVPKPPSLSLSDLQIAPGKTASFLTLSKAAMVDDTQTKLKIFAKDRFGDEKAADRYGVVEDEVLYVGDDGRIYQETPTGFLGGAREGVAGMVGKSFPILGAVGGAIAGAPLGPMGAIPGAAGGAAMGEGIRKGAANVIFDEPQTVTGNIKSMAGEAGLAALGEVGGQLFVKALQRNLARDFSKMDRPEADRLMVAGRKYGIELNPAQATNLPSLRARHDLLANAPYSSDIIEEGLKEQAGQANVAGYKFLDDISDLKSARIAGSKGKEASIEVIAQVRKERSEKARPFYEKAFSYPISDTSELAGLANRPSMQEAVAVAKKLAADEGLNLADPMSTAQGLHFVKMAFDNMLKEPPRTGTQAFSRKAVAEMRGKVYDFLNKQTEGNYGAANRVFSAWSGDFDRVAEGLVSGVADVKERSLNKAARILFTPDVAPEDTAFARRLFVRNNRTDEWNALLRSYMQDVFEQSGREFSTTGGMKSQAPKFRAQMMGNPRQAAILKNAMSLEQWDNFGQLMDVFEALGRTPGRGGSQTYARGAEEAAMRRESGAGVIGQVAGLASPQNVGSRIAQFLADVRMGNYAEEMAKIMTSPDAMRKLKQLNDLPPGDERLIVGISALLGVASPADAEEVQNPRLLRRELQ